MEDRRSSRPDLVLVLRHFPDQSARIRRLYLSSNSFRSLCEDYDLACRTMDGIEAALRAGRLGEAEEFGTMIAALRNEIAMVLASS